MNYVLGKRILNILNHVIFPAKIQISKPIDVSVFMFDLRMINMSSECEYDFDTEKYQPARQNTKFVTRSPRSLDNKLDILARHANIFGINQFTSR